MTRNTFKRETSQDMTAWDLNCRQYIPHNKSRNKLEKKIKRKARRKYKLFLKKVLTELQASDII